VAAFIKAIVHASKPGNAPFVGVKVFHFQTLLAYKAALQ